MMHARMMRFPSSFIERVRSHFRVSEVVGRRVPLKRHGREFQACCPFHNEKSPSFTVNDEKGFYHCFGCGAHGDVIKFVMEFDKRSYPEAITDLANEAGIALPVMTEEAQQKIAREVGLYEVMEWATQWFEAQLARGHHAGQNYLAKRGLVADTIARFRLGYAPPERDGLKRHLAQRGVSEALMLAAGLVIQPEHGATYDRFRDRVMFPIRDSGGKVIAFGGRLLDASVQGAKYVNSPETELFHKGDQLYNFDLARRPAMQHGTLLVVEGYMDVIALAQAGIAHAVAPLGTAITETQLKRIWRTVAEPVLCLDGDAAGKRAMLRAAELAIPLLASGLSLRFAMLPPGEDPDSVIKQGGHAAFEECIAKALPLVEVVWQMVGGHQPATTPEAQAALEKRAMEWVERFRDPVLRHHYKEWMKEKLRGAHSRHTAPRAGGSGGKPNAKSASYPYPSMSVGAKPARPPMSSPLYRAERQVLAWLALAPALLHQAGVHELLVHMVCEDAAHATLRDQLLELEAQGEAETAAALPIAESWRQDAWLNLPKALLQGDMPWAEQQSSWNIIHQNYTLLHMRDEYQQLERELAVEWSEVAQARAMALKKQIMELDNARFAAFDN